MANPNKKVKRPDGLGKLFRYKTDEDKILTLPIEQLLIDNYIYLHRAVKKENFYIMPEDSCYFFKEIVYDNEVVGFATYRASRVNEDSLVMQYMYILPDYRNKGLLVEEIDDASLLFESNIIIEYPTKQVVEELLKHKLARRFNDRYVVSRVPFIVPMVSIEDATSGVVREEFNLKETKGYSKLSLVYDLELCAVVGLASEHAENMFVEEEISDDADINDYNTMSLPLRSDDKEFDCINKRRNDSQINDGTYFKAVRKIMDDQNDIIQNWLTIL
ncbi:GNAT family N-acetyltransferase [Methanosphaera sp. WGK6]|uniref:GNAT family N-acetyltransferase n=1 Tax=Methanosphaera sp. WGK6 TaxID=1561964 RepID=UPI00084CA074|nr:GNAT family N-acetyltransferase [Methanosphaera sp. WGK6]OED29735.1 hypothetical protein NL43_06605 [Methanosphaera sp. WGK6]